MLYRLIFATFILWSATVGAQQPVAYYKMDKNAGDQSGNNNHGALRGNITPVMDRFGHPCGALLFDGKSGYIEVPSSPTLEQPVNSFSVTVWYRLSARDNLSASNKVNAWLTVICKGNTSNENGNPQYRMQVQQNSLTPSVTCSNARGSGTISINTEFTKCDNDFLAHILPVEEWAFYAIVYNGSSVVAYMNDQKVFEQNYSGVFSVNSSPLFIGFDEPGVTEYFSGAMDDLRIFGTALTENQVMGFYRESRPEMFNTEEFTLGNMPDINLFVGKNSCSVPVNFIMPAPKSNCGAISVYQAEGPRTGEMVGPGNYSVTLVANSETGYEQAVSFNIAVRDTVKPVLNLPKDIIAYAAPGKTSLPVSYAQPVATDNCTVKEIKMESGLATGSEFPLGETLVRFSATDASSNRSVGTFKVIVKQGAVVPPPPSRPPVVPPVLPGDTPVVVPPSEPKDSSVIIPLPQKKDSAVITPPVIVKNDSLPDNDKKIQKRRDYQHTLEVTSSTLMLELYDNAEIDQDTITLFLNKKVILEKQMLSAKPLLREIEIDTTIDNELVLYAENLGSIPPNTATLIVVDKGKRYSLDVQSDLGYSGTIIIRKRKTK